MRTFVDIASIGQISCWFLFLGTICWTQLQQPENQLVLTQAGSQTAADVTASTCWLKLQLLQQEIIVICTFFRNHPTRGTSSSPYQIAQLLEPFACDSFSSWQISWRLQSGCMVIAFTADVTVDGGGGGDGDCDGDGDGLFCWWYRLLLKRLQTVMHKVLLIPGLI